MPAFSLRQSYGATGRGHYEALIFFLKDLSKLFKIVLDSNGEEPESNEEIRIFKSVKKGFFTMPSYYFIMGPMNHGVRFYI